MRLRTKLVMSFLFMSVLPLTGIVLYSYYSSIRTLRTAAVTEATVLTAEIGQRMESVRDSMGRRLRELRDLPVETLVAERAGELATERFLVRVEDAFGDAAHYVESLEFIPAPVDPVELSGAAPSPPALPAEVAAPALGEIPVPEPATEIPPFVIFLKELGDLASASDVEGVGDWMASEEGQEALEAMRESTLAWGEEFAQRDVRWKVEIAHLAEEAKRLAAEAERLQEQQEREAARLERRRQNSESTEPVVTAVREHLEHRELESTLRSEQRLPAELTATAELRWWKSLDDSEREEFKRKAAKNKKILGQDLDCAVEEKGKEIGRLRARISAERLLGQVLARARRERGEIPFAVDSEGNLYLSRDEDRELLEGLPIVPASRGGDPTDESVAEDWVLVRLEDEDSGLTYGIARPLGQSLARLRRTAGRNFGYGLGLVGLALVGMAPLSRRITRGLGDLTRGAEELARGRLDTRVPVRSRDEVGNLARTFNTMAAQLCEDQKRLLEQERLRKESEIRRRLLEAENERRGRELEEARRFQFSLLPKRVPDHHDYEIGVFMKTATEVGGDYYDFHQGADGSLTVAVGDATGHGARAGTMVTVIKSLFTARGSECEPAEFLTRAAEAIQQMELGRMAMAFCMARFSGSSVTVATAGMPPLLLWRLSSGTVEEVALQGVPLGTMPGFEYRQHTLELDPGDGVLLMSDGFPELADPEGEPLGYGEARTIYASAAAAGPDEIIAALVRRAEAWTGGTPQRDDMTFVALKRRI